MQAVQEYRQNGASPTALAKLAEGSPLGQVLAAGLRNHKSSRYVMKDAVEEAGRSVTHELERFLTTLGTIASISPLMGLFGTVVGMIEIFGSQSPTGANPMQLKRGMEKALDVFKDHLRGLRVDPLALDGGEVRGEAREGALEDYGEGDGGDLGHLERRPGLCAGRCDPGVGRAGQ